MRFEFNIDSGLQRELENLASGIDKIAPAMIDAATPILERSIKNVLQSHRRSGDLINSVVAHGAKLSRGVYTGVVRFEGYSTREYRYSEQEVPNAQKAVALEYGTSKQRPQRFMQQAVDAVEGEVIDAMEEAFMWGGLAKYERMKHAGYVD